MPVSSTVSSTLPFLFSPQDCSFNTALNTNFLNLGTLIAVASPSNANAASAGVAIGQFYTGSVGTNPAIIYVRTA